MYFSKIWDLHIYDIYNQNQVSNPPELLGYTYLRDIQVKNLKKNKKNRYERMGYTYLQDIQVKNLKKINEKRYERIEYIYISKT